MTTRHARTTETGGDAINWRQTAGGIEIYDETNPDAWINATFIAGTPPEHRLFTVCPDCGGVYASRCKPGNVTVCGDCGAVFEHDER